MVLDREPGRWNRIALELRNVLDYSGADILSLTERFSAVDAKNFIHAPTKDREVEPFYTLGDQLFVEPQPLALPTKLELDTPIRMSRAEIAVARSHINVWREIAVSNHAYVLILEDDVWFRSGFPQQMDKAWNEIATQREGGRKFDILYVSYLEVNHGAPKTSISKNVFRPEKGLWHLSGYILSPEGAEKLLRLLPCRGPVDLWINHKFGSLDVRAMRKSLISQRRDTRSSNSYSILPSLTTIGAISSEGSSLFNIRPTEKPVFAIGPPGSGHSSLAMALSMLGYRCCSDLQSIPELELERLLDGRGDRIFDAYVNVGTLISRVNELRKRYPSAKFFLTETDSISPDDDFLGVKAALRGADVVVLRLEALNQWKIVCEHLRCSPPTCSFPALEDLGQRKLIDQTRRTNQDAKAWPSKRDRSPWIVENRDWWLGIRTDSADCRQSKGGKIVEIADSFETLDSKCWLLRGDTFTDNLALFRSSNVEFSTKTGAVLSVRKETLGVRAYSAASLCSQKAFLFGRFEASIRASNVSGIVTGFFLHRNSPRQEIDIEIAGNRPDRLIVNVFYNPGDEGANYDYGYRGSPAYIDLGFDASKESHRYAIEWDRCEIRWFVDDDVVHKRAIWEPTPIPHLPMTLHVNTWPTRSVRLAGRLKDQKLPSVATLRSITLKANSVESSPRHAEIKLGS